MHYDVRALAERWACGEKKVLRFLHSGELKGFSIASEVGGKPRWRISQEAVEAFEAARSNTPPAPKRRRRKKQPSDVIEFF